jgi:hypothetical protein
VLTKDEICTLIDVVIANPMHAIYFPNLAQLKDLLLPKRLKPKKRTIAIDTPPINSSF